MSINSEAFANCLSEKQISDIFLGSSSSVRRRNSYSGVKTITSHISGLRRVTHPINDDRESIIAQLQNYNNQNKLNKKKNRSGKKILQKKKVEEINESNTKNILEEHVDDVTTPTAVNMALNKRFEQTNLNHNSYESNQVKPIADLDLNKNNLYCDISTDVPEDTSSVSDLYINNQNKASYYSELELLREVQLNYMALAEDYNFFCSQFTPKRSILLEQRLEATFNDPISQSFAASLNSYIQECEAQSFSVYCSERPCVPTSFARSTRYLKNPEKIVLQETRGRYQTPPHITWNDNLDLKILFEEDTDWRQISVETYAPSFCDNQLNSLSLV